MPDRKSQTSSGNADAIPDALVHEELELDAEIDAPDRFAAAYQKAVIRALSDGPRTLREIEVAVAGETGVADDAPVEAQVHSLESINLVTRSGKKLELTEQGHRLAPYVRERATG